MHKIRKAQYEHLHGRIRYADAADQQLHQRIAYLAVIKAKCRQSQPVDAGGADIVHSDDGEVVGNINSGSVERR